MARLSFAISMRPIAVLGRSKRSIGSISMSWGRRAGSSISPAARCARPARVATLRAMVPPVAITAMRFVRPIASGASDIFMADDTLSASPLAGGPDCNLRQTYNF